MHWATRSDHRFPERNMTILTDNIDFARIYVPEETGWQPLPRDRIDKKVQKIACRLMEADLLYQADIETALSWQYLFLIRYARVSQYDVLVQLAREDAALPHGTLCVAGSGRKFHGFRNRSWATVPGNIHLSAYLAPRREIPNFGAGFMVLAAVAVLHTLDSLDFLKKKAGVKWVNDILLDHAKVCGVLAYTQTLGKAVKSAILGIGLNVETTPAVEPTPFVPKVGALQEFIEDKKHCSLQTVLFRLLQCLETDYDILLKGHYLDLLEVYRKRSLVIGKEVSIWADTVRCEPRKLRRGKVAAIGQNLELYFEDHDAPVTKGRLVFERA